MKNYHTFILEQSENDNEISEDETPIDWKLTINISKIWNQYSKSDVTLEQFNSAYIELLKTNKNVIEQQTTAWNDLNEILIKLEEKKTDEEGCLSIWDDIYDWGDTNLVEIKTQNKSDF